MKQTTALATAMSLACVAGAAQAGNFTFTDDADWDTGIYASTNSGPPGADDQVQLDPNIVTQFDFIWVAASGRDGAVLIDTDHVDPDGVSTLADSAAGNGAVLGEYRTAPQGQPGNPSRTTVDLNGDVWIGNRNAAAGGGSAVKITSNPGAGPTSSGVWNGATFDRLDWDNAGSADTNGGTSTADDVAITQYIRTDSTNNRTIAIDASNNVWIGGTGNRWHNAYTEDGVKIGNTSTVPEGGYGGLIDGNGILWSSDFSASTIARYDTNAPDPASSYIGSVTTGGQSYGLGIDSGGNIWNSHWTSGTISKLDSNGNLLFTRSTGGNGGRGVAVTPDDNIWVANSFTGNVTRLDNNGDIVSLIPVGNTPTGVSVDSNGKVWVTNLGSDDVVRIDPATNQIDLRVELGGNADPYNYSDMTGSVSGGVTNPTGNWVSGAIDGGSALTIWEQVFWNQEPEGDIPVGTTLDVQLRVADTEAGLSGLAWTSFASGDTVGLQGQYAQIRAVFTRPGTQGAPTPVLSDVTLTTSAIPLPATGWLVIGGLAALAGLRRRRAA